MRTVGRGPKRSAVTTLAIVIGTIMFAEPAAAVTCSDDGFMAHNVETSLTWTFQYGTCDLKVQHGVFASTAYSQMKKTNSSCASVTTFHWGCHSSGSPCSNTASYTTSSTNVWVQAARPQYNIGHSKSLANGPYNVGDKCTKRGA